MSEVNLDALSLTVLRAPVPERLYAMIAAYRAEDQLDYDRQRTELALRTVLEQPDVGRLWLLSARGELCGYVALSFGFSLEFGGRDAFLDELYVAPAHRRLGYARRALTMVDRALAAAGIQAIHLEVQRANIRAQRLYRRLGWTPRDRMFLMSRYL